MSGGTFTAQNKVRPGAYFNFKAVPAVTPTIGNRGVVTLPLALEWGESDKIIEVLSSDLVDGKAIEKIGYDSTSLGSLSLMLALQNCYKALVYRIDTGGQKATATLGELTATAKYPGKVGNEISVAVVKNEAKFDVVTTFRGIQKDVQTVTNYEELKPNNYVTFSGSGAASAQAGTALSAGSSGTVQTIKYDDYFKLIKTYNYNTMGIPSKESEVAQKAVAFVKDERDRLGHKVQAVVYKYPNANYEGIISVDQGYKTTGYDVDETNFVCYVAGLTAGSQVSDSNTYKIIPEAVSIIGVKDDDEITAALKNGQLVLSATQSGNIVIEQDINTLHEYGSDKSYAFTKNKIIRILDAINNDLTKLWEDTFLGKVANNENGLDLWKTSVISYLNDLVAADAITTFDSSEDVKVSKGNEIDSVVTELAITPVDTMEKLYATVVVG